MNNKNDDKVVLEEDKGIKLLKVIQRDEYQRAIRTTFGVYDANGRRIGNNFTAEPPARALYNQVLADS